MKEITATITSKGQVTVPVEVRRALGLQHGDEVVFQWEGRDVRLIMAASRLAAGYRSIPALTSPITCNEIEALLEEERARLFATDGSPATR